MRRSYIFLTIVICFIASCKKESYTNATIVKNCTGTYLRVLDKEYLICGGKKTSSFENGQAVLASFKLTKACKDDTTLQPTCEILYPNDGLIDIIDIKKR